MSLRKSFQLLALAGIALLSACGPAPDRPVDVRVTLRDFAIESSLVEFEPGVRYHFIVTNAGQVAHEFMIMPASEHMGMAGMDMAELDEMALMMIPEELLPAGATAQADFTFPMELGGQIEMVCNLNGHFQAGMHTPIVIE
jgi:uncharacterized cupredoxin-like copper-binding protein